MGNEIGPCVHCRRCTARCEVLQAPNLDIGRIGEAFATLRALGNDDRVAAVRRLSEEDSPLYHALRRCCFCSYCTADCPSRISASERMRLWRPLFVEAGLMSPDESRLTQVDNEWNIFSAYRAIYSIAYPEFTTLEEAASAGPGAVDTLFFPGCSLASYGAEVMRAVGVWLDEASISWAVSLECCGSPLMSMGLFERAQTLRERTLSLMRQAGITRMVTVCPGCGDEFAALLEGEIEIVPLPELMAEKGVFGIGDGGERVLVEDFASFVVFDSCHDREQGRHGRAVRQLLAQCANGSPVHEMCDTAKQSLCCGAGGAVAGYDGDVSERRVWRVVDEAAATKAACLVTTCPTCAYTVAQALLAREETPIEQRHYLEIALGARFDWPLVFSQLEGMWTGQYASWLAATFFPASEA